MRKQQNESSAWWTCQPNAQTTRRQALARGGLTALGAWLLAAGQGRSALAQTLIRPTTGAGLAAAAGKNGGILILIFLRGGADGLSMLVPHGDDDYYKKRLTLAIGKPKSTNAAGGAANVAASRAGAATTEPGVGDTAINLNGFFGLHPALGALYPLYADGLLAPLHAVGSQDQTRSHFEAMATMERGLGGAEAQEGDASGWLARHLSETLDNSPSKSSPLRAVAWGEMLPDSLRGATNASVLRSLDDFRLQLPDAAREQTMMQTLRALYDDSDTTPPGVAGQGRADSTTNHAVSLAGRETLATLDALKRLDPSRYKPANSAVYPQSDLGNGLRQTACLIKGEVGLEAATLDRGGWDTHVGQGGAVGWLSLQLADVGDSVAAFVRDLGKERMRRVTMVVMTEFGRRVEENGGLGTDHGRASAMFVIGGGINGGKVYAQWPGLAPANLDSVGDMKVTTDYRAVLAEIARTRLRNPKADALFPGFAAQNLGLTKPT